MPHLSIDFATMSYRRDVDTAFAIGYSAHDAPFADTNSPEIRRTFQFHRTGWTRVPGQRLNPLENPQRNRCIEGAQFLARGPSKDNRVISHVLCV